jgi:hypothetical protein
MLHMQVACGAGLELIYEFLQSWDEAQQLVKNDKKPARKVS